MTEPRLARAGEILRAHVAASPTNHARSRAALVEACALAGQASSRRRWPWAAWAALPAAAVVTVFIVTRVLDGTTVHFTVGADRVPGTVGAFVAAPGPSKTELQFSDGSSVLLEPRARVRVAETSRHGAHLAVEEGRARIDVTHRKGTRWAIAAGPYTVDVIGTSFEVGWAGATSTLDLSMHQGVVVVHGPGLAQGATVRAPEHFTATAVAALTEPTSGSGVPQIDSKTPYVASALASADISNAPVEAPSAGVHALPASCVNSPSQRPPPRPKGRESGTPRASGYLAGPLAGPGPWGLSPDRDLSNMPDEDRAVGGAGTRSDPMGSADSVGMRVAGTSHSAFAGDRSKPQATWSQLAAAGRYADIVSDAGRRGTEASLNTTTDIDLMALANAARYTGHPDLARRALLAIRSRFTGSVRAASAAFLLGRTAEDTGHASEAIGWYDRYLNEAPSGALAAEALGRAMVVRRALGQLEGARKNARAYLDRFPDGAYAPTAREMVKMP